MPSMDQGWQLRHHQITHFLAERVTQQRWGSGDSSAGMKIMALCIVGDGGDGDYGVVGDGGDGDYSVVGDGGDGDYGVVGDGVTRL